MKVEFLYEAKSASDGMKAAKELTAEEKKEKERIDKELEKLNKALHDGEQKFKYKKKDGTIRTATGTLKTSVIPKDDREDKRRYTKSEEVFYYYDIEKDGWRAFRKENYLGMTD